MRKRYTVEDVINNRYYQLPKFLFEGEFQKLSNDARVLYSLLKDRHELSLKNGWVNDKKEVYLIFTRENMCEMLGCSQPTLRKAISQLREFDLLQEERQGQGLPNLIYLTSQTVDIPQTEKSFQSGMKEFFSLECKNLSGNLTYISETEKIDDVDDAAAGENFSEADPKAEWQKESIDIDEIRQSCSDLGVPANDQEVLVETFLSVAAETSATMEDVRNTIKVMSTAEEKIYNAQGFIHWALKTKAKPAVKVPSRKELSDIKLDEKYRDVYLS